MEEIQKIDYQALNYEQVREKFISCCGKHLKLLTDFPESTNRIGTLLLKDGTFFYYIRTLSRNVEHCHFQKPLSTERSSSTKLLCAFQSDDIKELDKF